MDNDAHIGESFFFNQFFETDLLNELIHYNNVDFPMLTQAQ